MNIFWNLVIKCLTFVYGISWIILCILEVLFEGLLKTWKDCARENTFPLTSINMADSKEVAADQNALTEKTSNNDIAHVVSTTDGSARISIQQVDEQLFFDYFQMKPEQPFSSSFEAIGASLDTENLDSSETGNRRLCNTAIQFVVEKECDKADFIEINNEHCPKSTLTKTTDDLPNISEAEETNEDISPYSQPENKKGNEKSSENKLTLLYFDNFNNITNITKIEREDNSDNWVTTLEDVTPETDDALGEKKSGINIRERNEISMKNKITNSPAAMDATTHSEQQDTMSNIGDVFLETQTREVDKKDGKGEEKLKIKCRTRLINEDSSDESVFPENDVKGINTNSRQNPKIVKDKIKFKKDIFLSGSFSENDVINERLQKESNKQGELDKHNTRNLNKLMLSAVDEKSNSKMRSTMDTLSQLNFKKCSETILSELEKEHAKHAEYMTFQKVPNSYYDMSFNFENNELFIKEENVFKEVERPAALDFISWEIPAETREPQVSQKKHQEIPDKQDQNKGNLLDSVLEDILKQDENNNGMNAKDSGVSQHETVNTINVKQLTEIAKFPRGTCFESHCNDGPFNMPVFNSSKSHNNYSRQARMLQSKKKSSHKASGRGVERSMRKQDHKQVGKQLDIFWNTNNSTESVSKQRPPEKIAPGSRDRERNRHSRVVKEEDISENELGISGKDFVNKMIPKPLRLKKVKINPLDDHLTAVDSKETRYEKLQNECPNRNHKLDHHHNAMLFGHCSECKPKKTVAITHAGKRALSKDSLPHVCYTDRLCNSKPRSAETVEIKPLKRSAEKRVTFAEDIAVFSYIPSDSIFETFYNYSEARRKEQSGGKERTTDSDKASEATRGDIIDENLKETASKMPDTLTKMGKSPAIGDTLSATKEATSEIEVTSPEVKNKARIKETLHYDNMGFVDCSTLPGSFEIDLTDSTDLTFRTEEDEDEKTSLLDYKVKTSPWKISVLTRNTECKAKKWFKESSMSLRRLSLRRSKSQSKK